MTVIQAVCARLSSVSAVSALVGTRVWAMILPQEPTFPCVRVSLVDDVPTMHLRGVDQVMRARVQVDAVTDTRTSDDPYAVAHNVASAVFGGFSAGSALGLAGWSGTVGSPGLEILAIVPDAEREQYLGDELRQVWVTRDYFVDYIGA